MGCLLLHLLVSNCCAMLSCVKENRSNVLLAVRVMTTNAGKEERLFAIRICLVYYSCTIEYIFIFFPFY